MPNAFFPSLQRWSRQQGFGLRGQGACSVGSAPGNLARRNVFLGLAVARLWRWLLVLAFATAAHGRCPQCLVLGRLLKRARRVCKQRQVQHRWWSLPASELQRSRVQVIGRLAAALASTTSCCLTLRSWGLPPAKALGPRARCHHSPRMGQAPSRRQPLSSNVRRRRLRRFRAPGSSPSSGFPAGPRKHRFCLVQRLRAGMPASCDKDFPLCRYAVSPTESGAARSQTRLLALGALLPRRAASQAALLLTAGSSLGSCATWTCAGPSRHGFALVNGCIARLNQAVSALLLLTGELALALNLGLPLPRHLPAPASSSRLANHRPRKRRPSAAQTLGISKPRHWGPYGTATSAGPVDGWASFFSLQAHRIALKR